MIDEKDFSMMTERLKKLDSLREEIIAYSREITRESKHAIYAMHRNDTKESDRLIKSASEKVKKMKAITVKDTELLATGAYHAAIQEYVEACSYREFVQNSRVPTLKELDVEIENYLMGISDLTGEMERRAVHSVINGENDEVKKIWAVVSSIYEKFLDFDFRNSDLRKKSDSIKWNLKRIEEIMYDLSVRKKDGIQ